MGYITTYSLEWQDIEKRPIPQDADTLKVLADLDAIGDPKIAADMRRRLNVHERTYNDLIAELIEADEDANYALSPDGSSLEPCKWYDWEISMRKISKEVPGVLFTLYGEGEESGDIWNAYLLNGKMHKENAQIVIPPFDKEKLS